MKLTMEEQEDISAKGSFLKERLEGKTVFQECSEKEARFHLWEKKAGGSGGETAFLKRLQAEGITVEKAQEISKHVVWNRNHMLPPWLVSVNDMLDLLPADEEELQEKLLFDLDIYLNSVKVWTKQSEKSFLEVKENLLSLLPFIFYAENKLMRRLGDKIELFSKEARSNMSEILVTGLYQLVHKTISERLRIFILRKESFAFLLNLKDEDRMRYMTLFKKDLLAGGWKEIFLAYPVLPRIMTIVINNWVDNMELLSEHFRDDMPLLEQEWNENRSLGKVKSIKGSISDSHNKGKGVIIVDFESGRKIVYKPRNLQIDIAYQRLVDTLKEMGFPYVLIAPKALDFEDHGWIQFIEYKALDSREKAGDFYRRAGALLCLIYALGGNDFHGENMIACGEHPVLIDLETIISYKMMQFSESHEDVKETQDFIDIIQESVLGIGFLPIWLTTPNGLSVDFGALTGSVPTSIPSFEGKNLDVFEFKAELLDGFRNAYDFFINHREVFFDKVNAFFSESVIRIILRPTNVYAKMLSRTLNPGLLKDGFLYSIELERFGPAYLNKVEEDEVRRLWRMFLYERAALEARDIPIFYGDANKRDISSSEAVLCKDYFMNSVIDRIHKKLLRLGSKDKERQLDFINESLTIYKNNCNFQREKVEWSVNPSDMQCIENGKLLKEAEAIYEEIMNKSIKLADKNILWISYQHDLIHQKTLIGQTTASFYDGAMGISLFTSALYHITGDRNIKQNTLTFIEPFRKGLRDEDYQMPVYRMAPGFGNGLGGVIKALVMIGDYLGEKSVHEDALFLIEKITKEQILKEEHMNVLNGLSGLLLGLLLCYEKFGHEYSLELAKLCAKQILKNKNTNTETDFGYGSSGIVYSLSKLYRIHDAEIQEGLLHLLDRENDKYKAFIEHERKADEKEKPYCGIAGLGMMSLEINRTLKTAEQLDLGTIIKTTLEYPMVYGDHFYCGNGGRLDFLIQTSIQLDKPELLKEVNKYIHWMIQRKNEKGHYNIEGVNATAIANPSLFQGLSGIGYVLLRSLDPQKIGGFI